MLTETVEVMLTETVEVMLIRKRKSGQLHSYLALRKAVGWIGILLPFVLALGNIIITGKAVLLPNISVYYHTAMRDLFVGAICSIALFLFFYRGYDRWDDITADLAALFALGVAFFPTIESGPLNWAAWVHLVSASLFFITLAFFSLFLFTRSEKNPTSMKIRRNLIYRICGIIMLVALVSILLFMLLSGGNKSGSRFVFIAETVTLIAFGISWLTKGGTLYPDKPLKESDHGR